MLPTNTDKSKENETLIEWRKRFEQQAKYDYAQTHYQGKEDSEYIQSVSAHSRVYGMNSFKASLKEAIDFEIADIEPKGDWGGGVMYAKKKILQLLDTVKPKP